MNSTYGNFYNSNKKEVNKSSDGDLILSNDENKKKHASVKYKKPNFRISLTNKNLITRKYPLTNKSSDELYISKFTEKFNTDPVVDKENFYKENIQLKTLINKKIDLINELKFNYLKANVY